MPTKRITIFDYKENVDLLEKMWSNNILKEVIAENFGVSRTYIHEVVKRFKFPKRHIPKRKRNIILVSKKNIDILKKMYFNNVFYFDIGKHFGVDKSVICRVVKKLKLPKRKRKYITIFDSKENVKLLKKMYFDYVPIKDIATRFGINQTTIYKYIIKLKLPKREIKHIIIFNFKKNVDLLKKMYFDDVSMDDIGKHFGVSESYIYRTIKKLKLPTNRRHITIFDSKDNVKLLKRMYFDNVLMGDIGKYFGVSEYYIHTTIKNLKLPKREIPPTKEQIDKQKKWYNSPEGKTWTKKFIERTKKWHNSPEGKVHLNKFGERTKDYRESPEGKANFKKMNEDWHNSPEGKANIKKILKNSRGKRITNPQLCLYYYLKMLYSNIKLEYPIEGTSRWADVYDGENMIDYEFDGKYWHKDRKKKDFQRDLELHKLGITTIRFIKKDLKMFAKFGEPFLDIMKRSIVD